MVGVSIAPLIAATVLGGPTAGAWVALIGTTEVRELRGRVPWYGSLANHAGLMIPAIVAGMVMRVLGVPGSEEYTITFIAALIGAAAFFLVNATLTAAAVALQTEQPFRSVLLGDAKVFATNLLGLAPLAWLMAQMYEVAWWASSAVRRSALHDAARLPQLHRDARDVHPDHRCAGRGRGQTRPVHRASIRVGSRRSRGDIGRVMRLGESDLEALEWGGLLHDVGKIGVRDAVLLKQDKLNKEERAQMNAHPVLGAEIIAPVTRLSRELPIIRHHHEWYNGSGYPDRLIGDEIPLLARILHVADAFEAMTAARPYRMTPLTSEQALGELRKFAGVQFDPKVVDAFVKTDWAQDVADPGRTLQARPIPLISQHANRTANAVCHARRNLSTSASPEQPRRRSHS